MSIRGLGGVSAAGGHGGTSHQRASIVLGTYTYERVTESTRGDVAYVVVVQRWIGAGRCGAFSGAVSKIH